jgi:TRAP-type mannitol/chloroaromatic compound transport system permease small subunit
MLALVWFSFDMASESFESRETSFSAWNPPIWPAKGAIFVASVLMLLQGIVRLLEDIAIAFNLSYYDPAERKSHSEEGEA